MARVVEPVRRAVITSGVYSLDSDTTTTRNKALEHQRDILASDAATRGECQQAEPAPQLIEEQHVDTPVAVQHHYHQEAGCTSVSENLTASVNSRGCWKFDSRVGKSRSLAASNADDEDECHPAPMADDDAEDVPSESHSCDDDSLNTSRSSQREERNSEDATVKLGASGGAVVVKSRDNSSASNSEATKTCSKCHVAKPTSLFYKDSGKPDGFYTICKLCKSKWQKAYKLAKRRGEQRAAALSQQQLAATAATGGPPPCSTATTTMMAAAEEQSEGGAAARLYSAMRSSGRHWDELLSYQHSATHPTAFYHGMMSEDNVHRSASLAAGSSDAQRSYYSDRREHHQDDCYLYLQAAAASQARMAEWAARRMRSIPPPSRAAHYLPPPFSSSHYPAAHYYDRPSPAGTDSAARGHHRLQRDGRQQPSREQGNIESSSNAVAAAPLLPLRHHFTDTRYDEAFDAHHGGGGAGSVGGSLQGREESSPQQDMRPQQRRSRTVDVLLRRHGSVSPTDAAPPTHSAATADEQELARKVPSGLVHALDERMASNPSLERVKFPDCWHHQAPPSSKTSKPATEDGPSEEPPSTASRHESIRQWHRHVVPCATADSDAVAGYHCGRSSGSAQARVVGVKREADSPEARNHSDDSPRTRQRSSMHCSDADECGGVDRQQRINGREQRRIENTSIADSSTQVVDERVLHMAMLVLRSNHSPHVQEMMLHDLSAAECVRLLQSSHLLPSESCDMLTRCILGQSPMYVAHRNARGKWPPTGDDHTP